MGSVSTHIRFRTGAAAPALLLALVLFAMIAFVLAGEAWADPAETPADAATSQTTVAATSAADTSEASSAQTAESPVALPGGSTNVVNPRQTPDNSFLYDTSIVELTDADSSYQGKTVQITGEVVGDAIWAEEDPGKHWITIEDLDPDADNSISVLIDDSYLDLIDTYGVYGKVGTTLQVRGTYHLTCTSHEGIMDLHADTVKLISAGHEISRPFRAADFAQGAIFVLLGLGVLLFYGYLRERER